MSLITSLFTVGAGSSSSGRAWCRPSHRTNCAYVTGGNACCICIPASSTSWVIEMWGQGGGGAGSCCCMGSPYGGMGGSYGHATCTTSTVSHMLCVCACACTCFTPAAGQYSGHCGQFTRICDCGGSGVTNWITTGGQAGTTVCQCMYVAAGVINGNNRVFNPFHSTVAINCCWWGFASNNHIHQTTCALNDINLFRQGPDQPFELIQGTHDRAAGDGTAITCSCCTNFNFYVKGGCGFTAPDQSTQFANDNAAMFQPICAFRGAGYGRGGASYAGAAAQCCDCSSQGGCQFGGTQGNMPGGGGSSASGTGASGGCCLGGQGGTGLVLISWS